MVFNILFGLRLMFYLSKADYLTFALNTDKYTQFIVIYQIFN